MDIRTAGKRARAALWDDNSLTVPTMLVFSLVAFPATTVVPGLAGRYWGSGVTGARRR